MSGVEVAALVGGLMGAGAAGISALKDSKELRNGFSSTTMETTYGTKYETKIARTNGKGKADFLSDGSLVVSSSDRNSSSHVPWLDGLPLALATAGTYLGQVATSFQDHLRLYKKSWLKLQQTSPQARSYEDRALYSTWQLSFDHIKGQSELAAQLRTLMDAARA